MPRSFGCLAIIRYCPAGAVSRMGAMQAWDPSNQRDLVHCLAFDRPPDETLHEPPTDFVPETAVAKVGFRKRAPTGQCA